MGQRVTCHVCKFFSIKHLVCILIDVFLYIIYTICLFVFFETISRHMLFYISLVLGSYSKSIIHLKIVEDNVSP